MARRGVIEPTDEEDAEINRGIAADPDAKELSAEWFAGAIRSGEAGADLVPEFVRRRGPQKAPTKVPVAIRLDADVVEKFKRGGPGWQTRINEALRKAAG